MQSKPPHKSSKIKGKKAKPKISFNFWMLVLIFLLSFSGCFALYMTAVNLDKDFFSSSSNQTLQEQDNKGGEQQPSKAQGSETAESNTESAARPLVNNPTPKSDTQDESYLESCTFIADSLFLDAANVGRTGMVLGNSSIGAMNVNTLKIESTVGMVTTYEVLKVKKPARIYIMLGNDVKSDNIAEAINEYSTFISNIISSLPNSKIYIMQIPPSAGNQSNEFINEYNSELLKLANIKEINCLDTNTFLKDNDGKLSENYISAETGKISESGYNAILDYILSHVAQ